MALTNTTLSAACTATDLMLAVTSTSSGFPAAGVLGGRQLMLVGGEYMLIEQVPASGVVKVMQRGYNGTAPMAHEALTRVTTSAVAADWSIGPPVGTAEDRPPFTDDILYIGVDTTFTAAGTEPTATTKPLPIKNTTYVITKASACAITIISATALQLGVRLRFVNGVAAANTVTYTAGFKGDTTSSDVATSVAKVGAVLDLVVGHTGLLGAVNTGTGTDWTVA